MSISTASVNTSAIKRYRYVATGGETSISGADANNNILSYTPNVEQVFINGVLQVRGQDYTATNGSSITGLAALTASDSVEIVTFEAFTVATALGAAQTSAPSNPVEGQIWLDTDGTMADGGNIALETIDAKGDLLAGTADNTISRLAVGSNGQYLKADSTTATGLAWATLPASGKVLQVVSATYSTVTSSSSSTYADTGLTASITPSATTSKILVLVSQNGCRKDTNNTSVSIKLLRGVTDLALISNDGGDTDSTLRLEFGSVSTMYLDSPSTTSSTTYKTQFRSKNNNANAVVQNGSAVSTITLLEIGA